MQGDRDPWSVLAPDPTVLEVAAGPKAWPLLEGHGLLPLPSFMPCLTYDRDSHQDGGDPQALRTHPPRRPVGSARPFYSAFPGPGTAVAELASCVTLGELLSLSFPQPRRLRAKKNLPPADSALESSTSAGRTRHQRVPTARDGERRRGGLIRRGRHQVHPQMRLGCRRCVSTADEDDELDQTWPLDLRSSGCNT